MKKTLLSVALLCAFAVTGVGTAGAVANPDERVRPSGKFAAPCGLEWKSTMTAPTVIASDDKFPTFVLFYIDGKKVETNYTPSSTSNEGRTKTYQLQNWDLQSYAVGQHRLRAEVLDADGHKALAVSDCGTKYLDFKVVKAADTTAPEIIWTNSAGTVAGVVKFSFRATDDSGKIDRVELYKNGELVGKAGRYAPAAGDKKPKYLNFAYAWKTKSDVDGEYKWSAKAFDKAGNAAVAKDYTGSTELTFVVKNNPDENGINNCEKKLELVTGLLNGITERAEKRMQTIASVQEKVAAYYPVSGVTVENYDLLVATIAKNQTSVEDSLLKLQAKSVINCELDYKMQVKQFVSQLEDTRSSIKTYKQSVKDLIKAIQEAV